MYITKLINVNIYKDHILAFDILMISRSIIKAAVDYYMLSQFIKIFYFFCSMKLKAYKHKKGEETELSFYNKMIIYMTIFLWFLNCINSLIVTVVWGYFQTSFVQNDPELVNSLLIKILF